MLIKNVARDHTFTPESTEELCELLGGPARVDHLHTSSQKLYLDEEGVLLTTLGALQVTASFMKQLYKVLGLSLQGARELPPGMLSEKFSEWKAKHPVLVVIAHVGDVATGFIVESASSHGPSSVQVFGVLSESGILDQLELRRATISYCGNEFAYIQKDLVVEAAVGDLIDVGMVISNSSETGGRSLQAEAFTERLVCSNGARLKKLLGVAQYRDVAGLTPHACTEIFTRDLAELIQKLPIVKQVYGDVEKLIPTVQLDKVWGRVVRSGFSSTQADGILGLSELERMSLQEQLRNRTKSEPELVSDLSIFEVHNRLTFAGHSARFIGRRVLEEIGGQLLVEAMRWAPAFSKN